MLGRALISLLLICAFCLAGLPVMSKPKPKTAAKTTAETSGLTVSTTTADGPDGKSTIWKLTGQYRNAGGGLLNLRATTTRIELTPIDLCPGCSFNPGADPNSAESPETVDYEYSNSEMSKSDGTPLVETTLEYNESAQRSMFYVTLNSVQFNIDLNAQQEIVPVSEEDRAQIEQWLQTDDGRLVQQAGIALIQQGANEPENDALLTYWLIAMMVGDDSTAQAAIRLINQRKPTARTHHASMRPESRLVEPLATALCPAKSLPGKTVVAASIPALQCQGCCGVNCYCIRDWFGRPMYSTPCAQHDTCSRNYSRLNWRCLGYLYGAMQVVVFARVSRR